MKRMSAAFGVRARAETAKAPPVNTPPTAGRRRERRRSMIDVIRGNPGAPGADGEGKVVLRVERHTTSLMSAVCPLSGDERWASMQKAIFGDLSLGLTDATTLVIDVFGSPGPGSTSSPPDRAPPMANIEVFAWPHHHTPTTGYLARICSTVSHWLKKSRDGARFTSVVIVGRDTSHVALVVGSVLAFLAPSPPTTEFVNAMRRNAAALVQPSHSRLLVHWGAALEPSAVRGEAGAVPFISLRRIILGCAPAVALKSGCSAPFIEVRGRTPAPTPALYLTPSSRVSRAPGHMLAHSPCNNVFDWICSACSSVCGPPHAPPFAAKVRESGLLVWSDAADPSSKRGVRTEEGAFAIELEDVIVRGDITISLFDRVPRTSPAIPMLFARLSFSTEDAARALPSALASEVAGAETKAESVGEVTRFAWAAIDVADPAWQWIQDQSFARQIERDFHVDIVLLRAEGESRSRASWSTSNARAAVPLRAASGGTDMDADAATEKLGDATIVGVASAEERSAAFEAERTVIMAARTERSAERVGATLGVSEPWLEADDSDG